jgi:hypothetical protein
LIELIGQDARRADPRLKSPTMALKYYGAINDRLKDFVSWAKGFNKNIVVICHTSINEKQETYKVEPKFGSANNSNMMLQAFDCVGMVYMMGKERMLTFNPTENNLCGNSLGIPEMKLTVETNLWDILAEHKQAEVQRHANMKAMISGIVAKINACKTNDELLVLSENIKSAGLGNDVEVRTAYRTRSAEISAKTEQKPQESAEQPAPAPVQTETPEWNGNEGT